MNELFLILLNAAASVVIIVCSVLSLQLLIGISRELKGLEEIDVMWKYFIIMSGLFILLGMTRALGTIGTVIFSDIQPIFESLISVILIIFAVFAVLLSISLEEITE